jgi:predicted metal-dependent peptidase
MAAKPTGTHNPKQSGGRLTDTTDPALDRTVRDKLVTARIGLLLRAPFFGNLATRLELVNADSWLPTAATDGRKFYYNTEFCNKLKPKELEFLFGHEVLHNVYDHMGRTGDRDRKLFNCAADFCVNSDLIEQRIGDKITPCLYDPKYKGWSAEEVYDDLYEKADKIDIQDLIDQMLDEHLDDKETDDGPDGEPVDGSGKGRPRLTKAERDAIKDEIREAMLQAAQATGAGNLPAGVKRLIKDLTQPVVNWRELLEQQIQSTVKDDFSWMRPNRRSWHMDAVMPGMKPGTQIDVCVAIDTSGSISENDLRDFLSEVKGIMESYDEYKIRVITWDTSVYNPQEFTSDNMTDITTYQPGGGGGTDPHCVWEWLQENDIEPKKLIMFTDFCFFGWEPDNVKDYCDTVWVIKGNPSAEPEFGVWAHYDEAKQLAKA